MNALALLVNAANAESESASTPAADAKNITNKASVDASILAGASSQMHGVPSGAVADAMASREGASKERLATIMLQREREQQELAAVRQATIMRLIGSGSPPHAALRSPIGAPPPGTSTQQEAEYLQRLRLEALVRQRHQEALNQLTNGGIPTSDPSMTDTNLQEAILLARAEEELRKQQLGKQLEQEHQRKQLEQIAMLELMANRDNNTSAFVKAIRAAKAPTGASYPNGRSSEDSSVLQLLKERHLQQTMAHHLPQGQKSHFELQHLHGVIQGERADLVRAALAASTLQSNPRQAVIPSQIVSTAEEQEKQKILQLQQDRKGTLDQHQLFHQQALLNQRQEQEAAVLLAQKQQESNKLKQEMQRPHKTVEKDAAFHDSKSTILPCRARGMPMDHNLKTAYFVIPPNTKHGTELLCSYFTCRNAGIKFRYCVYCKLPVAKRNFAKRHNHSGKKLPDDAASSESLARNDTTRVTEDDSAPRCIVIDDKQEQSKDDGTLQSKDSSSEEKLSGEKPLESVNEVNKTHEITESPRSVATTENSVQVENVKETSTLGDEPKKMEKDNESTSPDEKEKSLSSKDTLPVCVSAKVTMSPSKRHEAWEKLLLLRPKVTRPNSDAMQAWIQEVLRVSDCETEFESDGKEISNCETHPTATADEIKDKNVKRSKTKALLSRKKQEDIENSTGDDDSYTAERAEKDVAKKDLSDKTLGKRESVRDNASTSSEESVDLRVQKKARK